MTTTQRPSLMPSTMHHIFIGGPSQITLQWPYAVRVDLVTSWSPGRKKRRATSWRLFFSFDVIGMKHRWHFVR